MNRHSPLVVGRVVVFTDNHELAKQAAALVNREHLIDRMPSGVVVVSQREIRWVAVSAIRRFDSWQ